jgi:hypothetical protein
MRVSSFEDHPWTNGWTNEPPWHPRPRPPRRAIEAQARHLAERLRDLGWSFGAGTPAQVIHWLNANTGELVVALSIGDLTYHEGNGKLIVQRERAGRLEWTRLGDDGEPVEPWEGIAPPPSRSTFN